MARPLPILCGRTESFEITGDKDCQKRGFDVLYFDEVDVGQGATDYVVEFRSAGDSGSKPASSAESPNMGATGAAG